MQLVIFDRVSSLGSELVDNRLGQMQLPDHFIDVSQPTWQDVGMFQNPYSISVMGQNPFWDEIGWSFPWRSTFCFIHSGEMVRVLVESWLVGGWKNDPFEKNIRQIG